MALRTGTHRILKRVGVLYAPEAESAAVRRVLADQFDVVDVQFDEWSEQDFAFIVIGSCAAQRHAVIDALHAKIGRTPSIFIVNDLHDAPAEHDWLERRDLHRLPYIVQREVQLRETEILLRESERRHRDMLENAHEGLWIIDAQGITTFINRKMAHLLETTASEVIGRSAFELVDPDWRNVADVAWARRKQGIVESHDVRFRRPNGTTFFATVSSRPIYDQSGRFAGASSLVIDITARRQVEEELLRRETELSIAHELARLGSWELDVSSKRLHGSRELFRLLDLGDRTGALDLEEWMMVVASADVDRLRRAIRHALETQTELEHEFGLRGSDRILHARGRIIIDSHGTVRRIIGMAQDVTQIRRDAETLARSEQRYRALVEQATDIIFSLDVEQRITSLNPAFETTTGWRVSDWIGRPFADCIARDSQALAHSRLDDALAGQASTGEIDLATASGRIATIEMTAQAIGSPPEGLIGIARDVTQRKRSERALEQEKRLASLGHLAASVAHEFNNVLMSIMPFAELLKRRAPDDERTAIASHHIFQAIRRGRQISQEILRFARPAPITLAAIDVEEWIGAFSREATALVGPKYPIASHGTGQPLFMRADRASLERVITNLVVNARDAMPEGGTIRIAASVAANDARLVAIAVSDEGAGIADTVLPRIFDPLFTTKAGSTGLGLSIVHSEVMQMGGTVRVETRPEAGSTFTVLLPRAEPPAVASTPARREEAAPRRILVVEDDDAIGEGLRTLLEDEGYDVRLVMRGGEAPRAVGDFAPDVVILDVNLPDMSGLEVLQELRETHPDLQVILSTGHADATALESIRKLRVPALMKPYEIEDLIALLERMEARDAG